MFLPLNQVEALTAFDCCVLLSVARLLFNRSCTMPLVPNVCQVYACVLPNREQARGSIWWNKQTTVGVEMRQCLLEFPQCAWEIWRMSPSEIVSVTVKLGLALSWGGGKLVTLFPSFLFSVKTRTELWSLFRRTEIWCYAGVYRGNHFLSLFVNVIICTA